MRIAYVEPIAGLNVYGRELLPHLARHCEVEVVTNAKRDNLCGDLIDMFPMVSYAQASTRAGHSYDRMVFHLRNNPLHVPVYNLLLARKGVSVMHEVNLSGIIGAQTLMQGRRVEFLRHVLANEGMSAFARTTIDWLVRRRWPSSAQYNMNQVAVRHSQGVIVHNRYAQRQLLASFPNLPVHLVARGVPPPQTCDLSLLRKELGLVGREPVITSFGFINARKRTAQALEAFARFIKAYPQAVYVLVGKVSRFDLEGTLNCLGLTHHVRAVGRVDDSTFAKYLAVTDIGVNLRYPTEGETSSTALRIMSYGKPVLVTNTDSLAEFPDDCVIKVNPGVTEVTEICQGLLALAGDESLRKQIGQAAAAHVAENHTWEQAARSYVDFLSSIQ